MYPVIVVDDETSFTRVLVNRLESQGQPAVGVASAFDALEVMDDGSKVALMLVDVRMPDIDGGDFVRALGYLFPRVPCALMSGYPVADVELPPGVPLLRKPFSVQEVLDLVSKSAGL